MRKMFWQILFYWVYLGLVVGCSVYPPTGRPVHIMTKVFGISSDLETSRRYFCPMYFKEFLPLYIIFTLQIVCYIKLYNRYKLFANRKVEIKKVVVEHLKNLDIDDDDRREA